MIGKRHPLRISVVGAGAVGSALALLLSRRGHRIVSVVSSDLRDAKRCALLTHCRRYSSSFVDLHPSTDLILIATPDGAVQTVASSIARTARLNFPGLCVCHTSGVLTSLALEPLRRKKCLTFSFHPIQTFPAGVSPRRMVRALEHISYGVEGSPRGLRFARRLVLDLGGRIFIVPKEQKILYHLTCVIASNYSTALVGAAEELAKRLEGRRAMRHFTPLINASIANAIAMSPAKALTGPIARGDSALLLKHLEALRNKGELKALYRALGFVALSLARRGKKLTLREVRTLRKILAESA